MQYTDMASESKERVVEREKNGTSQIAREWEGDRWEGIERPYTADDVARLRGSIRIEHTLARMGAERLWTLMNERPFVRSLGALTGNQAVQQVKAGLEAIYLSGWQVAADANLAGHMYPDQSLYPANSVPHVVRRINQALQRADQIHHAEGRNGVHWFAPIVADAEAGFGGALNVFELMKAMIEAGAAGVHFEDQLASEKKCGHMGGKVLIPTSQAVRNLISARLAADVMGVPTVIIARTDADAASLITSDVDPTDHEFLTGERTMEGFYGVDAGMDQAISRGLSYAPYADVVWCETSEPDLEQAQHFADAIHEKHPGKLLAYNCSPSFNWKKSKRSSQPRSTVTPPPSTSARSAQATSTRSPRSSPAVPPPPQPLPARQRKTSSTARRARSKASPAPPKTSSS
jgi:isocitrate lyase